MNTYENYKHNMARYRANSSNVDYIIMAWTIEYGAYACVLVQWNV